MDADRWHRMQDVFHAALEVPDAARAAFVAGACVDDAAMARSVRAMLDADAGGAFLDADVASVARDVLDVGGEGELGTRIGPYRIKAILGEGGSGVVYLAVREDIGHDVAIKVLRDAWVSSHRRDRFLAEQRTLAEAESSGHRAHSRRRHSRWRNAVVRAGADRRVTPRRVPAASTSPTCRR